MEKNPDSINLEWFHHMKCWKTFCDEGKSEDNRERRKRAKELALKGKGPASTEVSPEVEPPCNKETHMCFQRYVCIICGRDAS